MSVERTNPLTKELLSLAEKAGFEGLCVVEERYTPEAFGNAGVTFAWENLLLHFLRDRSIESMDLGQVDDPSRTYFADMVRVFLGHQSLDDVLNGRSDPPSAEDWLVFFIENSADLKAAFSPAMRHQTVAALDDLQRQFDEQRWEVQKKQGS